MVQANYCHCPSAVALQLPAASAIFVEGREGRRAHLFFSPGTQLIGLPSAPISLALMDSQSVGRCCTTFVFRASLHFWVGVACPYPGKTVFLRTRLNNCTLSLFLSMSLQLRAFSVPIFVQRNNSSSATIRLGK